MCFDNPRMKYLWTEEAEYLYQILEGVADYDWWYYDGTYLTYVDKCCFAVSLSIVTNRLYNSPETRILKDLLDRLSDIGFADKITKTQYQKFLKCSSWDEVFKNE